MVKPQHQAKPIITASTDPKGHPSKNFGGNVLASSGLLAIAVAVFLLQPTPSITDIPLQTTKPPTNNCRWRPEPLQGTCDVTKPTEESQAYKTAVDCENACCENADCITFQYRQKEGCLWGKDTRLGAEKDGVSAWCEPRPPAPWNGQRIKEKKSGVAVDGACSDSGWNQRELSGQCFGLGPKRQTAANTPEACRDACCQDTNCGIWQWRADAGCFYSKGGFNCQEANPLDFEKFVGKRKVQEGRVYEPYAYSQDFADLARLEKQ